MEGVRALAALTVVLAHAYWPLDGHGMVDNLVGLFPVVVPIFFGLSGFLLFRPYVAAFERGERGPSTREFWRRRALRILPGYWVALTLGGLLFADVVTGVFSDRWWVFYGLGQSFSVVDNGGGISVAWTLSVDAVFYLLLPLLALAARRFGYAAVLVPMFVLGPVIHFLNQTPSDVLVLVQKLTYAFPGETNYFAAGMLLAVWSVRGAPGPVRWLIDRPGTTMLVAGGVYLAAANVFTFQDPLFDLTARTRFLWLDLAMMVIAALVLVPAAFDVKPSPVRTVLGSRVLAWVSLVSFGLYLWHGAITPWLATRLTPDIATWSLAARWPVLFLMSVAGGLAAGALSYYVVERPFLELKERRGRRGSARRSAHAGTPPSAGAPPRRAGA